MKENLGYEAPLAKFDCEEEDEDDNNKNVTKNAEKSEMKFSEAYMRALNFCETNPFMNNIELKSQDDHDENMIDENNNNENQVNLNFTTKDKIDAQKSDRSKLGSDEWLEACLESSDLNGLRKAINSLFIHNNMESLKYAMPPCCRDVISYNNNSGVPKDTNQYTNEISQYKTSIINNDFNEIDIYYNNIKNKFKKMYKIEDNSTNGLTYENNDNDTSKLTKEKYNTTDNKNENDYENIFELIDANNNKITACEDISNSLSFQSNSCIDDSLEDIFDFNENFGCDKSENSNEKQQKPHKEDKEKNISEKNEDCTQTTTVQTNGRLDNFCECLSRSLEDLVNTFDERITSSLRNFQQKVETFAPVQNKEDKNHAQTFREKDFAPMSTIQDSAYFSDGDGLRADNLVDSDEEDNEYIREKYRDERNNITYLHNKNTKNKNNKKSRRIKVYKYDERYDQVNDENDKDEDSYSDDNSCLSTSSCSSDEYDDSSCCYDQEFIDRDIAMIRMGEDDADDYTPSAEQVICEIEEIFKENFSTADPIYVNTNPWMNNNNRGELDVESMTCSEVASMCEGLEINTSILSDELVRELNMRDELEYEKETRNRFIYLLLLIQQKKKEKQSDPNRIENKNKNNDKNINNNFNFDAMEMSLTSLNSFDNNELNNTKNNNLKYYKEAAISKLRGFSDKIAQKKSYLSTVIPYSDDLASPSLDILIIYNQILQAIAENSSNSLALLTDYILKVLCPKA